MVQMSLEFAGVYQNFIDGRQAIVNQDYATRDAKATLISEAISRVVAYKAISYLEGASAELTANGVTPDFIHDLSEGYGFIYSLQFTLVNGSPYLDNAWVETTLTDLENGTGFWEVSATKLDAIKDEIKLATGL